MAKSRIIDEKTSTDLMILTTIIMICERSNNFRVLEGGRPMGGSAIMI